MTESAYDRFKTSLRQLFENDGLSNDQVDLSREAFGMNELGNSTSILHNLLNSPLLLTACYLSVSLVDDRFALSWKEFSLVLLHGLIHGAIRRYDKIIMSLSAQELLNVEVSVRRHGIDKKVQARELVVGDIIKVIEGDVIPVDSVVVEAHNFSTNDTSWPGSGLPTKRVKNNLCLTDAIVTSGRATLRVIRFGSHTTINTSSAYMRTTLYRNAEAFLILIILLAFLLALTVRSFLVLWHGMNINLLPLVVLPYGFISFAETSLTNAAYNLTIMRRVMVHDMSAVERLALTDILLADKTGIVTENKLIVHEPYTVGDFTKDDIILAANLASDFHDPLDAIDKSFRKLLEPHLTAIFNNHRVIEKHPFNPKTKCVWSITEFRDEKTTWRKGAPLFVLRDVDQEVELPETVKNAYKNKVVDFARSGRRTIGVARKKDGQAWEIMGVVPMEDQVRPETKPSLRLLKKLGIAVKFLSGDAKIMLQALCNEIGHGSKVFQANEIKDAEQAADVDIFAEAHPSHKAAITAELKKSGLSVAVFGSGTDDMWAYQSADVSMADNRSAIWPILISDITFKEAGLSHIAITARDCRQILNTMHNLVICQASRTIHLLGCLFTGVIIDRTDILLILLAGDIIGRVEATYFAERLKKPFNIKSYSIILGLSLLLSTFTTSFLVQKGVMLQVVLTQSCTVLAPRLKFSFNSRLYRFYVMVMMFVNLVATFLSWSGWVVESSVQIGDIAKVWLISAITIAVMYTICLISDGLDNNSS